MEIREVFHLEHGPLRAEIGALGAELLSLCDPNGEEQMWSGAPDTWPRRGPVIFPILGGWPKGGYFHNGKRYQMDKNGFARSCLFEAELVGRDSVALLLQSDERTRVQYPFFFRLEICYTLTDTGLRVNQRAVNIGDAIMPAALGLHPGFRWDRSREGAFLRFSCPQAVQAFHPDGVRYPFLKNQDRIPLSSALFERGAVSLEDVRGKWVELSRPEAAWNLRIYQEDYPYLTLWSMERPEAAFLCIEPSTSAGTDGDCLLDRRGITALKPGQALCGEIGIEFEERKE